MPSGRTNNFPESGRGLRHVTPTIFGSMVGYPSDSLASCYYYRSPASYQAYLFNNDNEDKHKLKLFIFVYYD